MTIGHNSSAAVKSYAKRIFSLDQQIAEAVEVHVKPLREDRKDLLKEAEGQGFNKKALVEVVRKMKLDNSLRAEISMYEDIVLEELLD